MASPKSLNKQCQYGVFQCSVSETSLDAMEMESSLLLLYFFSFLALYFFSDHLLRKIRNYPPSPFPSLPVIGHLYLFKMPLHRTLSKVSAKYGPILYLNFGSRPVLLVTSSSAAEECLTRNDVVFANRPRLLAGKYLGYNFTSLIWSPYGDHWRNLRRISSLEILSSHRLQLLSCIRSDEVRLLVRRILKAVSTTAIQNGDGKRLGLDRTVEMKSVFVDLTMNVMMRMIAGKRYFGDQDVEDDEEGKAFQNIVTETFLFGGATNLGDFLPVLRWVGYGGLDKKLKELHRKREDFMQRLVEGHKKKLTVMGDDCGGDGDEIGKTKTMIEVLLKLQESEPDYYKDELIRSIMLTLLVAGTDTLAATMEWGMSLLVNNPEVLKKSQIEIDNYVGHDRLIEESDLTKLPYLHNIIIETMRMYPAGPLSEPHESSDKCIVGGYRVPRGTMLLVNLWAIHNDPKIWEEPRKFKPERFEGQEVGVRDGFKLMPFGFGRRGCPGEGLALRMVGLALGTMIQCFEWERVGEEMVDMMEGPGLTLPKAKPLEVKCKPRSSMVNLLSQI